MTSERGYPAYAAGYGAPIAAHSGHSSKAAASQRNRLCRLLWTVVAIIGPTSFGVCLGSPQVAGYPVRLSVLAAIVAAVGLLPRQSVRGWVVVTLAVAGLLDGVAALVPAGPSGGALISIVALAAAQSIAALAALLQESGVFAPSESTGGRSSSPYQSLVQAYQAYVAQYQQYCQESVVHYRAAGRAEAQGHADSATPAARAQADTVQESFSELQAKYARHSVGAPAQQSLANPGNEPTGTVTGIGVADGKRTVPGSYPYPGRQHAAEQSISEPTEP